MVHRKAHRKAHRKSHKKSHKKVHRKSHRKQHGGAGSCAAMPLNYKLAQVGGMAPFAVGGNDYLLDAATRVQAEVAPLDKAFAELPAVIPRQAGGARKSRKHKASRKVKHSRKHKQSHSRRRQRGGALADFAGPYVLLDHRAIGDAALAQNPQFANEGSVNPLYREAAGAQ